MDFTDKVILITGASSGIGADAARHLASLGGRVAVVGRNTERVNAVAGQIKAAGAPVPLPIVADVTKDAQRIVDETVRHFGKLDVLVNNAAILALDEIDNLDLAVFDRIFDTNVRSVMQLTHLAIPHLEQTKGNIVNISSVAGLKAIPQFISYSMSKAALDHFTRLVAVGLAPKRIRVNSINPAAIRTPIFETVGITAETFAAIEEESKHTYLVGRIGEVSDTSSAIAYLASDSSSFLTGITLTVDGGSLLSTSLRSMSDKMAQWEHHSARNCWLANRGIVAMRVGN